MVGSSVVVRPMPNDLAFAVEVVRRFEELCDHTGAPFEASGILARDRDISACGCAACHHGPRVAFAVCDMLQVDLLAWLNRGRRVIRGVNDGGASDG